jgi:hypothetical protein
MNIREHQGTPGNIKELGEIEDVSFFLVLKILHIH